MQQMPALKCLQPTGATSSSASSSSASAIFFCRHANHPMVLRLLHPPPPVTAAPYWTKGYGPTGGQGSNRRGVYVELQLRCAPSWRLLDDPQMEQVGEGSERGRMGGAKMEESMEEGKRGGRGGGERGGGMEACGFSAWQHFLKLIFTFFLCFCFLSLSLSLHPTLMLNPAVVSCIYVDGDWLPRHLPLFFPFSLLLRTPPFHPSFCLSSSRLPTFFLRFSRLLSPLPHPFPLV